MSLVINWTWTWSTTVTVEPSYRQSAILNLCFVSPGLVATFLMLLVSLSSSHVKGRNKYPVIGTTLCNFIAAASTFLMSAVFLLCNDLKVEINFVLCSVIRRLAQNSQSVPFLCYVVIAVDRLFVVCLNRPLALRHVLLLYFTALAIAATPLCVQLFYGNIFYEDICGYSLQGPRGTTNVLLSMWAATAFTALFINIAIILFIVIHKHKIKKANGREMTSSEVRNERMMMYGFTLQSFFPVCSLVPNNTVYFLFVNGSAIPSWVWIAINALTYLNHFINPILTAIFIKQFRTATLLFFRIRSPEFYQRTTNVTTLTAQRSSRSTGSRSVAWNKR
ncbi:hypothetical protein QR680_011969 [Steinernema hermaphroditum]|uniref:G-protein coupled receptors family 1 profile domain-containing protein n=1 Tax=Steinernema hermaphroditum TaxID=289476 RepID=A0AA39LZP3_9BILA|nr:hypothetical protein QR680_011969 [Steinernema hermaphroditum]